MAKRGVADNLRAAAATLGKRGGPARARALTQERIDKIAKMGGQAKARKGRVGK